MSREAIEVGFALGETEMFDILHQPPSGDADRTSADTDPALASTDPTERAAARARAAGELLEQLARASKRAKAERIAAVHELRAAGWSHQQVADALGLSRARAADLAAGRSTSGRVAARRRTAR